MKSLKGLFAALLLTGSSFTLSAQLRLETESQIARPESAAMTQNGNHSVNLYSGRMTSQSGDVSIEDTVRYVTVYYERPETVDRFIGVNPNEFRLWIKNYVPDEDDVKYNWLGQILISDKAIIKELDYYAKLGIISGNPKHEPMIPSQPISDIPFSEDSFKDYYGFDTYYIIEFTYNNREESVALGRFKDNGCYYLEKEVLTDDVGLYDYLRSHVDALRSPL